MNRGATGVERLDVAGLGLEFHSQAREPLSLLHAASSSPPGFAGAEGAAPALTVGLELTGSLAYRVSSTTTAAAELSGDSDAITGHLSAICRAAMSHALSNEGGALVHAAAAVIDDQAILLVAPSEGGKTTLSGLLARAGVPILSDETIALRPIEPGGTAFRAHGTFFWSGPPLPTLAGGWPLRRIVFLEKGPLALAPIGPSEALGRFLAEWHVAADADSTSLALATASRILETATVYRLSFALTDPPADIVALLRSGLTR